MLLAYLWNHDARDRHEPDDMENIVVEQKNVHNKVVYVQKRPPQVIAGRDFLGRACWKKMSDGVYMHVAAPAEDQDMKTSPPNVVRGRYTNVSLIEAIGDGLTRLTCVINLDFGGSVPTFIPNIFVQRDLQVRVKRGEATMCKSF